MNPKIRAANKEDIPVLSELLYSLFDGELEFRPDKKLQIRALELMFQSPELCTVFVIESPDGIVGMVALHFTISTALGGKAAILEDMVISREFRRAGYGTLLLQHAISYAKENGYLRITLLTDHNNDPAIAFYRKQGFVKSPMIPLRIVF